MNRLGLGLLTGVALLLACAPLRVLAKSQYRHFSGIHNPRVRKPTSTWKVMKPPKAKRFRG